MTCVVMVWFRADPARSDECHSRLAALGQRLAQTYGVGARSGWRDEAGAGYRTWLESYEPLACDRCEAFIRSLQVEATAQGLDGLAIGGRHVEVFEWSA
ncbi:MAG: DUF4936 family protein, partial [Burkholderiales bacterium]